MNTAKHCPNCGKPMPASALEGLCPECMLKVGAAADSVPETLVGPNGTVVVPPPASQPLVSPEIGEEFGRYRVLRRLGHGGMGVVYEAEETESGRRVALKVINQQLNSPQDRARFLREGRLAASINHPNCVYVYGTEEVEGTPVISMEFVTGGTLQQHFAEEGPLPVGRAVDSMLQVIEGLEAAQAVGILHRDIKPSNCFQDATGAVKIGDFGLSLSTLPREETNITESGVMVGTPAFCSPEQHRGEELDARTDMYAVGVTLYYLLTGKLPFEGQTMPQLIANTLEKRAQSPRVHRKEIPDGLARTILRCLSKHPSERFKSYADLRRALEPYSSVAPTPATLGLRLAAGALDLCLLGLVSQIVFFLFIGDPFEVIDRMGQDIRSASVFMLPWILVVIAYYGLSEWRWGATPGKAICRLRVVGADQGHPPLMRALARAAIFSVVPMLPYGLMLLFRPDAMAITGGPTAYAQGFGYYVLLGLLFVTVRRRNRFASLHDLATGTRVVSRAALARRSGLPVEVHPPAHVENAPQLGPYHVLEPLGKCAEAEWVMGYDLRLLRRVLIRKVPAGTPPLADSLRHLSRPGRLRWLTGRREATQNWDAFEGVAGRSLADLIKQPQSWAQVRFWLHDIAEELAAAEKDDAFPEILELDRVWITTEGRAKLLDFPAPGSAVTLPAATDSSMLPQTTGIRATTFLNQMARAALSGKNNPSTEHVSARLAIHARQFLESLPSLNGAEAIKSALEPLLNRTAEVTRLRRSAIVAGCLAFPVMASLATAFGISLMQDWQQKNPELMELSQILNTWRAKEMPFVPADKLPSDRLMGTYIAAHYGGVITNEAAWSSARSRVFIQPDAREFAETSLEQYGSPTAEELEEAEKRLEPIVKQFHVAEMPPRHFLSVLLLWVTLAIYVGIPAMLAALLFRGGLVLLATGVTYVRHDGVKASRLRLSWRSLVAWSPAVGAVGLALLAIGIKSMSAVVLSLLVMVILVTWSLWLPERGLQDRLAGTWPVPR